MFGYAFRRLLRPIFWRVQFAAFSLLLLTIFVSTGLGTSSFYVDPAWQGSHNGSPSQPWNQLTSAAWASINSALSNGNVTVYFAARPAGTNTDQVYDTAGDGVQLEIDLTTKTTNTSYFLTLDGKSLYNTNSSAPVWVPSNGTNMCVVRDFNSQNATHTKYSNISIHGFRIVCNVGTKLVTICGDNWTVENCDASHTAAATDGPGILLVPTADGAHEGSSYWAPPCTNIMIRSNLVHDTQGEAIYLGGGGFPMDGSAAAGYPSHGGVMVISNEIYNAGHQGAQGDGIDIKGGIYSVLISGNNIHSLDYTGGIRCIVSQGQTNGATGTNLIIERNFIHDCAAISTGAIDIVDSWGVPQGVVIRNNIIANIDGPGSSGLGPGGIRVSTTQDQALVANNTVYHCRGFATGSGYTNSFIKFRNNLFLSNNTNGNQVLIEKGVIDSDYNAYDNSLGYSVEGSHSISVATNALVNVVIEDFRPTLSGSLLGAAQLQTGFTNDFAGLNRGARWDVGALNYRPGPPVRVRIVP